MNKSTLAGLLLMFLTSMTVRAEVPEDCPCLHLNKKPKVVQVPQHKVVEKNEVYIVTVGNSEQKVKPVPLIHVVPQPVTQNMAQPVTVVKTAATSDAPVQSTTTASGNTKDNKKLSSFYLGLAAGAHYGLVSSVSPEKNYHFTGRIFGGYELTDNLAIEVGYFMMRPEIQPTGSSVEHSTYNTTVNSSSVKARRQGFDFTGVYKSTDILPGLYGKLGVAYERINFKDTLISAVTGIPARDRTGYGHIFHYGDKTINVLDNRSLDDNADFVVGLGYETKLTDHLFIRVDYTRYHPVKREIKMPVNFLSVGTKYQF